MAEAAEKSVAERVHDWIDSMRGYDEHDAMQEALDELADIVDGKPPKSEEPPPAQIPEDCKFFDGRAQDGSACCWGYQRSPGEKRPCFIDQDGHCVFFRRSLHGQP